MKLPAVVAISLVLAACGSSDPDSTASAPPAAATPSSPDTTSSTVPVRAGIAPRGETIDGSLTAPDGSQRTYHLFVPESLPEGTEAPLLVAMHGGTGWGLQFQAASGFDDLAEANGFLVVYPDGTEIDLVPEGRVWNGGRCCGRAQQDRADVDDVGFLSAGPGEGISGTEVELVTVAGAGHGWMGQPSRPAQEAISGPAYQDFDSALAVWTFLSAHPRVS